MLLKIASLIVLALSPALAQESLRVTTGLGDMLDRYLTEIAERQWKERADRVARLRTPAEVAERQAYIRAKVTESLGGFPEKTPLNPRITGVLERSGYRIEKLIYESIPGYYVTANVYVPTSGKPPFAAVLGTAGHTVNGKASATYQHVWISLAKRGILVLAYDPMGQGERSEYFDPDLGRSKLRGPTAEHTMAGIQCLLTGTNFARYELWDGIRGFDYLLTRRDVDAKRIGVAGNSGGGTQSAYLAVVEPRLAVAAPSCYITSWDRLWVKPGPQDAEQNFTNFLKNGLDFGDFLIAFAPRPLKVLTAIRDYFPIEGARATYAEARRIYEILDHPGRIDFFEYDDPHGWSKPRREATYRWMEQWLNGRSDPGIEESFDTELESNLYCTTTGQVATSLQSQTVQSLNAALAQKLHATRAALKAKSPAELRRIIAGRLGLSVDHGHPREKPQWSKQGELAREGYRIEKITVQSERGITIPALVFVPGGGRGRKPAILYLHAGGKAVDAGEAGDMEGLVRAGYVVLAVDPRGWGEAGAQGRQTVMRSLLVGRTLPGMQVDDVLRSVDYLATRDDVNPEEIRLLGKGNGGILALYVAALEPRIQRVISEGAVVSYMKIVSSKQHEGILDVVVPGVLRDFDLPDVASAIAPRTLWIADPKNAVGARVPVSEALKEYTVAAKAGSFRVLERPEGWKVEKAYQSWLQ